MNVDRLFDQPDGSGREAGPVPKRARLSRDEQLLEFLEADRSVQPQKNVDYNSQWVKNSVTRLGRLVSQNLEMHDKHSRDPVKVMDSEYELYQGLKDWSEVALALTEASDWQQCYKELCGSPVFWQVVGLAASHPNIDVREQVLIILADLVEEDRDEGKKALVQVFVECKLADVLGSFLGQLDDLREEPELYEQYSTLCLGLAIALVEYQEIDFLHSQKLNTGVLGLVAGASAAKVDRVAQYCSEYVSELLVGRTEEEIRDFEATTDEDLVELLMVVWSKFRKTLVSGSEATEFLENCLLTLGYLGRFDSYRRRFVDNEGLDLAMLFIGSSVSKLHVSSGLKVAAAMIDQESASQLVQMGVLKPLMKSFSSKVSRSDSPTMYILRVVAQLYKYLPFGSDERIRLTNKLIHKEFAGLEKILALWRGLVADESDNDAVLETLASANLVLLWVLDEKLVAKKDIDQLTAKLQIDLNDLVQTVDIDIQATDQVDERELLVSLRDTLVAKMQLLPAPNMAEAGK
ncbi:hypothetical protein OGAPHI_003002 [Ogataea philodendri]|uniref:Beta-catenin-like protein 1 N-terminal domain-containing protein n=1 Tax=Ogataea philodendri TaxID=1378263 RepID=A0A9P8T5T7_9ASCO|nr:uncharacterized protein OGAPHI_003002 [Ogataea philodendri]KAH3667353.1 hypothetical protein OGAPHI_003002 [Ogataea philodendri]